MCWACREENLHRRLCLLTGIMGIFEKHLDRRKAFLGLFGLWQPIPNFCLQMRRVSFSFLGGVEDVFYLKAMAAAFSISVSVIFSWAWLHGFGFCDHLHIWSQWINTPETHGTSSSLYFKHHLEAFRHQFSIMGLIKIASMSSSPAATLFPERRGHRDTGVFLLWL